MGILKIKNHKLTAQIDCRYPYGHSSIALTKKLQKALNPITVTLAYDDKPTLSDLNSPYIQMLLHTYREITNDTDSEPFISGGVTYSKAIGNCVAFGPGMKDDFHLAHQTDERINISKIDKLFEVYTQTMIRLANL